MLPKWHFLISIFVFLFLFFVVKLTLFISLFIALASFLIDVDHYLFYIIKDRNFNLKEIYNYLTEIQKKLLKGYKIKDKPRIFLIFHSIEFLALLFLLASIFKWLLLYWAFISFLLHLACDLIYGLITKTFELTPYSLIYFILKNEKKKGKEKRR